LTNRGLGVIIQQFNAEISLNFVSYVYQKKTLLHY
jgi:hypothetical protein